MLYLSTSSVNTTNIIEAVERLSDITKNIELSGGSLYHENLFEALLPLKQEKGINFLVHGYFPPPKEQFILNFADTSEKTREFIRETMRFVRALYIDYYSIHAGFKRDFELEGELLINPVGKYYALEGICKNIEWFNREFPDTKLALENLYPNNSNKESCFFMHINEIVKFLEKDKATYLLLDLGHLKVSSQLLRFNYFDAVETLLERYSKRILEIHLSENSGKYDDHEIVTFKSVQYAIICRYIGIIRKNDIKITIEARNYSLKYIEKCYKLFAGVNNI